MAETKNKVLTAASALTRLGALRDEYADRRRHHGGGGLGLLSALGPDGLVIKVTQGAERRAEAVVGEQAGEWDFGHGDVPGHRCPDDPAAGDRNQRR
jgi:hypothetical protein